MKVALGVSALIKGQRVNGLDGIGNYTGELLGGLLSSDDVAVTPCSYVFADDNVAEQKITSVGPFKSQLMLSVLSGAGFWGERYLPKGTSIFHSPDHYIPKFKRIP